MSRTFATSRIHREVTHAYGQRGSNQNSTRAFSEVVTIIATGTRRPFFRTRLPDASQRDMVGSLEPPADIEETRTGMAPPNLTRADAEARAALLAVNDYTVELDRTD